MKQHSNPPVKRSLREIARNIDNAWPKVHPYARPYLNAMYDLDSINDMYMHDSADEIVRRFLCNASTFKGEAARTLKAELKGMLNH